jgi:hypothetical protein
MTCLASGAWSDVQGSCTGEWMGAVGRMLAMFGPVQGRHG